MNPEAYLRQLELENQELKETMSQLIESKKKYKSRTKELLEVLESERLQYTQDADSLEHLTTELRQIADEKDLQLSKEQNQIEQLKQEVNILNSQITNEERSESLSDVLNQKELQDRIEREELSNYESLVKLEQDAHQMTQAEKEELEELNKVLIQTIESFIEVFNYTVTQMVFKNKEMPVYLQKVYRTLLVDESQDNMIIPVFIDQKSCNLQLLLSSSFELNDKTLTKIRRSQLMDDVQKQLSGLLTSDYLIEDQEFKLDEINFVPYKAYVIMQNFRKLNYLTGSQSIDKLTKVNSSHFNELLVSLSAAFQEYCQRFEYERVNQIIKEQKGEIDSLNRKLEGEIPYDVKMMERKIARLKESVLQYENLYKDSLSKKHILKKVHVQVGPVTKTHLHEKRLMDELRLLRTMVQNQSDFVDTQADRPHSTGHSTIYNRLESMAGHPGSRSSSNSGRFERETVQSEINDVKNRSHEFQAGCIATGKVLLQVIELTLNKLYAIQLVPPSVVDILKEGQARCREILMEILEGKLDTVDEE